jgi:hypothetical protein
MRYFITDAGEILKQYSLDGIWVTVEIIGEFGNEPAGVDYASNQLGDLPVVSGGVEWQD